MASVLARRFSFSACVGRGGVSSGLAIAACVAEELAAPADPLAVVGCSSLASGEAVEWKKLIKFPRTGGIGSSLTLAMAFANSLSRCAMKRMRCPAVFSLLTLALVTCMCRIGAGWVPGGAFRCSGQKIFRGERSFSVRVAGGISSLALNPRGACVRSYGEV